MNIPENILEVKIGGEYFGFDGDMVGQILRVPQITPLPLSPPSVAGVVSLGGRIVTVIDMGVILGYEKIDTSKDASRILTVSVNADDYALLVESAEDMGSVDIRNYESVDKNSDMICGFYRQNDRICQIVDIEAVCSDIKLLGYTPIEVEDTECDRDSLKEIEISQKTERFLFFRVGGESFALPLDMTREIVFMPQNHTPVTEASEEVIGMITLRDELIIALSFSKILGYPQSKPKSTHRLLIVSYDGKSLAVLVDEVEDVRDIKIQELEDTHENQKNPKIDSLYKDKDHITSIISSMYIKNLILNHYLKEEREEDEKKKQEEGEEMVEVVVFGIGKEEYALDIENVQEIIKNCELTPVPEAPRYVEGMINLRGAVIPIISLPDRLGFPKNVTEESKILVSILEGEKVGLFVDEVKEILSVEERFISKSKSQDSLFSEILNLDNGKRVILKLRNSSIIDTDTLEKINTREAALV